MRQCLTFEEPWCSANTLEQLAEQALARAKQKGASAAEVGVTVDSGLSVSARHFEVENLAFHLDKSLGITVYFGQSKGTATSSDISIESLNQAVDAACHLAGFTAADPYAGLVAASDLASSLPDLDLYHRWDVSPEEAIEQAVICERAAYDVDSRVCNTDGVSVDLHHGYHIYANSHGFMAGYPTSMHSISASVVAKEQGSMQRDYEYTVARDPSALSPAAAVGREAALKTLKHLGAKKIRTGKVPVIFHASVASGLVQHFLSAIRGSKLYRQESFLTESLGTQIFPSWLTMTEEPHIPRGLHSAPVDREGVATRRCELVDGGVVRGYLLSGYSARRLGMPVTGHAGGVHNLDVSCGARTLEQLLACMGTGLLVTELMGQGVNLVTGDYSRGARGFWIERGEIKHPVEEITIAGHLSEMFAGVVDIANDVDMRRHVRVGSMLLEEMTVAGA